MRRGANSIMKGQRRNTESEKVNKQNQTDALRRRYEGSE